MAVDVRDTPARKKGRKTDNPNTTGAVRPGTKRRIEAVVYLLAVPLLYLGYKFVSLQALESGPAQGRTGQSRQPANRHAPSSTRTASRRDYGDRRHRDGRHAG
jgi:hypothetical protein